ncbi:MAG: MATE family efflux transporter, partial [Cloacibacillus sp.]
MYEYNGDLINRRVWAFFIPGLIATISITLSMFLDILLVGRMVGPMEMGAVQMAMPVTMLFNMIYMLLGTGGEVLVASAKGERDPARANTIFTLT